MFFNEQLIVNQQNCSFYTFLVEFDVKYFSDYSLVNMDVYV